MDRSQYLHREEFETFERNVNRSFGDVTRGLETLNGKIDNLKDRGTDYRAIFAGLSFASTIILAIGGLIAWGLNNKMDDNAADIVTGITTADTQLRRLDEVLQREMRLLDSGLTERIAGGERSRSAMEEEIKARGKWMQAHDKEESAVNATQNERLESLERNLSNVEGTRFGRGDFDKYVLPRLDQLDERLRVVEREQSARSKAVKTVYEGMGN